MKKVAITECLPAVITAAVTHGKIDPDVVEAMMRLHDEFPGLSPELEIFIRQEVDAEASRLRGRLCRAMWIARYIIRGSLCLATLACMYLFAFFWHVQCLILMALCVTALCIDIYTS